MLIQYKEPEVQTCGCYACEVCEVYDSNHGYRPRENAMKDAEAEMKELTVIDSTSSSISGEKIAGDINDQHQSLYDHDAQDMDENHLKKYNEDDEQEKQQSQISSTHIPPPRKAKGPVGAPFKFGKHADGFFNDMRKWIYQHHHHPYLLPPTITLKNLNIVISNYHIEAYHYLLIQSNQEFPPVPPPTNKKRDELHKRKAFKMKAIKILKDYRQKIIPNIHI